MESNDTSPMYSLESSAEKASSITLAAAEDSFTNNTLPKSVLRILPLQLAEQYANTSVRGMLNLYLQSSSGVSSVIARTQVHLIGGIMYAAPLIGGMVADLGLGAFFGGILFSLLLVLGMVLLSVSSANGLLAMYPEIPLRATLGTLTILSIGIGGIKPCLTALASYQIERECPEIDNLPSMFDAYFRIAFLVSNLAILAASLITPVLASISCLGSSHCYPLGFGVASFVVVIACSYFYSGWALYIKWHTARSLVTNEKVKWSILIKDAKVRQDLKRLFQFFIMSLPLSFFWMLYDQGMTAWQHQYELMNKNWLMFELKTEMMANSGSFLLISWIIILTKVVDPLLLRHGWRISGIPRMAVGFTFLIIAFVVSIVLQWRVETNLLSSNIIKLENRVVDCQGCLSGGWQLPQWLLQSLGEALLGTAAPQFAYCQGGDRFRVLGPGLLFLTNSFGNILVYVLDSCFFHNMPYLPRMSYYISLASIANVVFIVLYLTWYRHILRSQFSPNTLK